MSFPVCFLFQTLVLLLPSFSCSLSNDCLVPTVRGLEQRRRHAREKQVCGDIHTDGGSEQFEDNTEEGHGCSWALWALDLRN